MIALLLRRYWLPLAAIAALSLAGGWLYWRGYAHGEDRVHRETLAVETPKAEARRDTAVAHSATVLAVATKARVSSDSLRAARVAAKQAALGELLATDVPNLTRLVALDDALSARDSVTIAVQAGAIDTLRAEIQARETLDSLRVETIRLGAAPDHHTTLKIVGGALVGALAALTIHAMTR